jgi:uncharacterized ion transporter superfamily protein YfcC
MAMHSEPPVLDVKWRNVTISAKGKDAIKAIQLPVRAVLILRGVAALIITFGLVAGGWWLKPYLTSFLDAAVRWWG